MAFYNSQHFRELTAGLPVVLVDAGARGELPPPWPGVAEFLRVIGFEPDEEECRRLNATAGKDRIYYPVALAGSRGTAPLYLTRNRDCASLLEPNFPLMNRFRDARDFEVEGTPDIPSDTLDNVAAENRLAHIDFIKVDTQGTELDILRGAADTLAKRGVFGIEVEAEFSPLYQDQPLFADVDSFLRGEGFTLFDISNPGRKLRRVVPTGRQWRGQTLWTNALYLRDLLTANNADYLAGMAGSDLAKTVAISELYGFGDYAVELIERFETDSLLSPAVADAMRGEVLRGVSGGTQAERRLVRNTRNTVGTYLEERLPRLHRLLSGQPGRISFSR